jgi:hypothetical protein
MIISHKYRYVYVELPRTGSKAISKELREQYHGSFIMRHHSTYIDFLKKASNEEKKYFVFSSIRNPLDSAVSGYFKYKTDHKQRYTSPVKLKKDRGIRGYLDYRVFDYLKRTNADFPTYFMKFYKIPYDNWASLSHNVFDFIIRFENIQEDFSKALTLIGIKQKRPLPLVNRTSMKERDFLTYYTPETIERAKRVFGPFMKKWGYEFPPEWGDASFSWYEMIGFGFFGLFRNFYWKHLRFRI